MTSSETFGHFFRRSVLLFLAQGSCWIGAVGGQESDTARSVPQSRQVLRVDPAEDLQQLADHPLQAALQLAYQTAKQIDQEVRDYTCDLVMRERIRGRLTNIHLAHMKLRSGQKENPATVKPFSVYLHFIAPPKVKSREVLFVHNQNDNRMLAKNGGESNLKDVTLSMKPDSKRAMRGRHYPITEIGMANIIQRLIEEASHAMYVDRNRRECQVRIIENARIEGRLCRCVQVMFPQQREDLKFHLVRVFLDDENGLPIRFAAYSWPTNPGGPPRLIEEYTFLNLRVNVGLTDTDFDRENPAYDFYSAEDVSSEDRTYSTDRDD